MTTTKKRLLTFTIGIPLVIFLAFIPFYNHLAINIAIIIFVGITTNEIYNISKVQVNLPPKFLIIFISILMPITTYILSLFNINQDIVIWLFIAEIIGFMAIECFKNKVFDESLKKIGIITLILFYTSYLFSFLIRITTIPVNTNYYLTLFFVQVFMCDSCAWFFGILFGKNNRGLIAASPNKSIVGFFGGILGTIFFSILLKLIFPEIFNFQYWKLIIISIITSITTIVGDLIESVFKRSSNFKDSGNIIPGRGGALDSVDSVIISAPIFYLALKIFQII